MTPRNFHTDRFGKAHIHAGQYRNGGLAIQLYCALDNYPDQLEPLATLSMWLPATLRLPFNCAFIKTYSENELVVHDAAASGWFKRRPDLIRDFGDEAWELLTERGEGFKLEE